MNNETREELKTADDIMYCAVLHGLGGKFCAAQVMIGRSSQS